MAAGTRFRIRQDLSPLRYPGGKRRLLPLMTELVRRTGRRIELFVEPFAGGAAMTIGFLESGLAERAVLADADPLVAAFWKIVFSSDAERLADRVEEALPTVDEWLRLRRFEPGNDLDLAYKCLFLNRTSFSGLLTRRCGPIGGRSQGGEHKIDCRFHRGRIAARIRELSTLRDRIEWVGRRSWVDTLQAARGFEGSTMDGTFVYLDPPFVANASDLYRYHFSKYDHGMFAAAVALLRVDYALSYDDHPDVLRLYGSVPGFRRVSLNYCARISDVRSVDSEVIVSPLFTELGENDALVPNSGFLALPQTRPRRLSSVAGPIRRPFDGVQQERP